MKTMKCKGDIILTDPMYLIRKGSPNDWKTALSEGYDHAALHLLGIGTYLSAEAGEDGRLEVRNDAGERVGEFCTDSALYCVCDLNEVLAYNPDLLTNYAEFPNTFCVIRDFDGEVSVIRDGDGLRFEGVGKNGFRTPTC